MASVATVSRRRGKAASAVGPAAALGRPRSRGRAGTAGAAQADEAAQQNLKSYLLYLSCAFVLAVALSWSCSTTARLGYRIDELKKEIAALNDAKDRLSYELSGLESASRIEREALAMGMVRPDYVRPAAGETGSNAAPSASSWNGGPSSAGTGQTATRVIHLDPAEPGRDSAATGATNATAAGRGTAGSGDKTAALAAAGPRSGLGSLLERFYRWLTGISQVEARDWQ